MKKLFFAVLSLVVLTGSAFAQQTKVKKEPDKRKTKTEIPEGRDAKVKVEDDKIVIRDAGVGKDLVYPYTAEYSSQFVPGMPANAKLVLEMWKAWDDDAYERGAPYFADTIVMQLPDGQVLRGKDSVLQAMKRLRSAYVTAQSTIEAWAPVKSLDRNEQWVAVWGREEDADRAGKRTTTRYHEIWRFNRDGKVDFVRQYTAQYPPR